ncbi:head protein [Corallococcus sp. bb12-1]|uniref:Head protein n=1 Tax=Corallococcus terminator TaxID=2316733 RepID=A0A3A8IU86_9BACT|nr:MULTISPECIES: head protein [Corallococcus]MCY1040388.1 head protein [Corallococcus sp. bb12-1]RKG83330.1 head protein [Corallococcus terminator]
MKQDDMPLEARELLGRLWSESQSQDDKLRLEVAIDALHFIYAMGLSQPFRAYRQSVDEHEPPLVFASFDTRAEADAWLMAQTSVPDRASVLVAGDYFSVRDLPELGKGTRRLLSSPILEFYLQDMWEKAKTPVASFSTREEAETWLQEQPEPPRQVAILIDGKPYLAAWHHRIQLRTLYPLTAPEAAPT